MLILKSCKGNEDYFMKKCNWKKVLGITGNVIFYALVVLILLFAVSNIKVKKDDDIPSLFGRGYIAIITDSMEGENKDSFSKGDLIIVKVFKNDEQKKKLNEGDVITFYDFGLKALNSHRIVELDKEDWTFKTKGDNENQIDMAVKELEDVKAVYVGKIKNVGKLIAYLQTPTGMALFIVLPTVAFLGYELFLFIRVLLKANAEKVEARLEADKEKLREELLEQLKKEQAEASEEVK